jgi:hypothetical protein
MPSLLSSKLGPAAPDFLFLAALPLLIRICWNKPN